MAEVTLKDISKDLDSQKKVQESTDKNIKKISDNMSAFLKMAQGNKLKDRETELEKKKPKAAKEGGMISGIAESGIGTMIIGFAKKFGLLIAGLVGAALALFDETFNDLARTVAAFSKGFVGNLTAKTIKALKLVVSGTFVAGLLKLVDVLKGPAKVFDETALRFRNIKTGTFAKAPNIFSKFIDFISTTADKVKSIFTIAEDGKLAKILKSVGGVIKSFGPILKAIFAPIGIVLTLFDVVKSAIEGAGGSVDPETGEIQGDGIIGVFTGAITGFFSSVFGAPLNLIRGMTTSVLRKLGIIDEKTEADLDKELDFEKIIDKFGKAVARFIDRVIESIVNFFKNPGDALGAIGSKIANLLGIETTDVADAPTGMSVDETAMELNKGTMGTFGTLFKDFGKGTPAILHGEEAVIPKNSEIGSTLSKLMDASTPMARFGNEKSRELKAKEDAMRAAGASDMEIAQSIMGDMGGIMGGLKAARDAGGLDKLKIPKMDTSGVKDFMQPQNLGSIFGSMVRESEEAKRSQAAQQPAPVIINDNSSQSGGTTNTAMPIQSQPFDFNDPFVKGLRMA